MDPPSTWDELVVVASRFQQDLVRQRHQLNDYPLVFVGDRQGGEATTYQLLPFLWAARSDLIADDRVLIDFLATRQTLNFLYTLIHMKRL